VSQKEADATGRFWNRHYSQANIFVESLEAEGGGGGGIKCEVWVFFVLNPIVFNIIEVGIRLVLMRMSVVN
jgi:hypothetical protein